jgi:hypothetical protein
LIEAQDGRRTAVEVCGVFTKGLLDIRRLEAWRIYRIAVWAGGLFQAIANALFNRRRCVLIKVRMPRYELAPVTIA